MKLLTATRLALMLQAACMLILGIFIPSFGPVVVTGGHLHLSLLKQLSNCDDKKPCDSYRTHDLQFWFFRLHENEMN